MDGADSPKPTNAAATITEGRGTTGGFARVVGLYEEAAATAERNDPDRERRHREDAMLAAVSWPPPHFPRETRLALLADVTEAKARRDVQGDPERAAAQAKRNRDNAYSNGPLVDGQRHVMRAPLVHARQVRVRRLTAGDHLTVRAARVRP